MTKTLFRLLLPVATLLVAALPVRAELPIISKARAYLGAEAALNSVKSIHYLGTLTSADAKDTGKVSIEIIFQAPLQQRIEARSGTGVEITALDDYDGWQRVQDTSDASRWKLSLLGKDEIKRLRANTWQNLAFFRGVERIGGKVEDQGDALIDGIKCRKIAFIHAPNIIFYRYFDQTTGRLVLSETEAGGSIREEGEIIVNGVRFPQTIVNTSKNADGSTQRIRIVFSKITLNETFAPAVFAVPSLGSK